MSHISLKGNAINTNGDLPIIGSNAKDFVLTKTNLADVSLKDFSGKKIILNIFPSIDTPVCAASVRRFNAEANSLSNTVVLCVSKDLPFAHSRFCGAEGLENVVSLSELRNSNFASDYGMLIIDGPMAGLMARGVIIINENGKIAYTQLVPEIVEEPKYDDILNFLK